jgi:hypothetical protein
LGQFLTVSLQDYLAGFQDVGPPGDFERHMCILFDEENGCPCQVDFLDDGKNLPHQNGREAHGGLIEEEQPWFGHEGTADGEQGEMTANLMLFNMAPGSRPFAG